MARQKEVSLNVIVSSEFQCVWSAITMAEAVAMSRGGDEAPTDGSRYDLAHLGRATIRTTMADQPREAVSER